MIECNFKSKVYGGTSTKYCSLAHMDGGNLTCIGEDNCFLFQIYKLLLALPKMSTIIDWDKTNTPTVICVECRKCGKPSGALAFCPHCGAKK